mgnify:CR=1 FL=1
MRGESVSLLFDDETSVGQHKYLFEASRLPSGIYLLKLQSGNFEASQKLVLLR